MTSQAIQTYSLDVSICQPPEAQASPSGSEQPAVTESGLGLTAHEDGSQVGTPNLAGTPGPLQPSQRSASLIDSEQSPLERGPSPAPSAAGSVDTRATHMTQVPATPPGPSPIISPSSSTSSLFNRYTLRIPDVYLASVNDLVCPQAFSPPCISFREIFAIAGLPWVSSMCPCS